MILDGGAAGFRCVFKAILAPSERPRPAISISSDVSWNSFCPKSRKTDFWILLDVDTFWLANDPSSATRPAGRVDCNRERDAEGSAADSAPWPATQVGAPS